MANGECGVRVETPTIGSYFADVSAHGMSGCLVLDFVPNPTLHRSRENGPTRNTAPSFVQHLPK